MAEKKKLPKYWFVDLEDIDREDARVAVMCDYMNSKEPLDCEWDSNNICEYVGFDDNDEADTAGFNSVDCKDEFDEEMTEITLDELMTFVKGKSPAQVKNVITKKSLPSVTLDGVVYNQPVGTVYGYNKRRDRFELISSDEEISNRVITLEDVEANKSFYGRTVKQPTHRVFFLDGNQVKFISGAIKVGCQTIPNEIVKAIAAKLIK